MKHRVLLYFIPLLLSSALSYSKFITITDEDHYKDAVSSNKCMLVEFAAEWCSVCNGIKKSVEEIGNEFDNITLAKVDVDNLDNISKQNGIVGVPTFVYIENGVKKVEEIGVQNMPSFKDHLRDNIRKTFKIAQNNLSMDQQMPMMTDETIVVDETPMAAPAEPNIFMRIINGIKNFIMLIFTKIKEFFTTIVDAIKGFFGS